MKPTLRNLLLAALGISLGATAASAAPWPPQRGDLLLGVQAAGGVGSTTNLFFNLGPAHALRDDPNPDGVIVNLNAELVTAFGADWATRDDLYFGVIGVKSKNPPFGLGASEPENGDPARTIYASRTTSAPGASSPWTGFSISALGTAANNHHGQVDGDAPAINHSSITANGNEVATVTQAGNPVPWNNSWSRWNPFLNGFSSTAYGIFVGGIQTQMGNAANHVDLHRILGTSGSGSYVTTVTLSNSGDVTIARDGGGNASYFTVSATATNGSVTGTGAGIRYASGSSARLEAIANAGFGFVGWSGDASGSANPVTIAVDGNKSVTANFAPLPSVSSPTTTAITGVSATVGGNVTNDGGQSVTERGIVFAPTEVENNPRLGGSGTTKVVAAGTTGVFTVALADLAPGTTYAFRAFATTTAGTGTTAVARFTTDTTVPFTGGVGTVPSRLIQAGDTHGFRFSLANAAQANFASTGAVGFDWELRDGGGDLVTSGTGNLAINELLAAGNYYLTLTNATASAATFSLNLDGSSAANPRPDVSVGPNAAAPIGVGRYAGVQRATIVARNAAARNGFARVKNDGAQPTAVRVQANRGNATFRVTYFGPGGNRTAQMTAAGFVTAVLAQGSPPVSFRANIVPNRRTLVRRVGRRNVVRRAAFTSTITGRAVANPAILDRGQLLFRVQ
jgi:uncharacterized repeat protein (TIGR02543 family)